MLENNGKMIIGRNFIFCLCVICLMFTTFGFFAENSFAVELNETAGGICIDSNDVIELENSQDNEVLKQNSNDELEVPQEPITPSGNIYKSIQDAVTSAPEESVIKLSGTYRSNGNDCIVINKKLTITADSTATLDGKHLSTAFQVNEGGAGTVFRNLKFVNGEGDIGSALIVNAKNVRIENCIFEDNHANRGGAVKSTYDLNIASGLIVDGCEFRRNTGYYKNYEGYSLGPALSIYGKDSEVRNCIFEDNWAKGKEASFGGAIQIGLDEPGSNAKVIGCTFRNNQIYSIDDYSHGGAGCVRTGTSYINCIFENNGADWGGALTFHSSGEIRNCTFINNTARQYGGALSTGFMEGPMDLTVVNCNFYDNSAPMGGAIQALGSNVVVDNSKFKNNHVNETGGAIHVKAEDVTIKNSVFNSNIANVDGGAIYIEGKNTVVENSSFISNEAIPDVNKVNDGLGGALYVDSSLAYVKDNTFRFNTARNGSAIYYDESGEKLTLENNELFQNQAWVYGLPISAEDIYYGDSEEVKVTLFGGNNIADFDNLAVSNAIYNQADNLNIVINGQYPFLGARNDGDLYQDSREYNINVLLTIQHEDGTVVYNEMASTNYLGEIVVDLDNLKPGRYHVFAKHYEDTYYKAINNATTFLVYPKVDNEITKSVSKENPNYDDVITWTISIKNHGPNDSTNVTVYDVLPDGLIWLGDTANGKYDHGTGVLKIGDLGVNKTFTFNITTLVNATGKIVNRVNVTSGELDTNTTNNFAEKSISVNPAADLSLTKSVSNPKPDYKDHIIWTIEVTNNGPDTAHNISMRDLLASSLIFVDCDGDYDETSGIWKVESLEKGKKIKLSIECIVNSTGLILNSASVNATEFDYDLTNNNDTERIFVRNSSDLAIKKTVNSSNANYGDLVKWALTVSNNGPDDATNIKVVDVLPDGFSYINSTLEYVDETFTIAKLKVGGDIVIEIITKVEATGNFSNFANVTCDEYDFDLTNNHDDEDILVNPACDLSVTKSVSDSNPDYNDIITWTIEVVNNGPDNAHNVTVGDLLADTLIWIEDDSLGDYNPSTGILFIEELGVYESFELNIDCRVKGTGLIQNNVSVNASEYDYNLDNNFDNETIDVEKSADVSVIKSVNNSSPNYNELVKWTLVISNSGPDKATEIYVEDILPDGLVFVKYNATKGLYNEGAWVMCCLEKGENQTLEIICRVNRTGEIINFASIHAEEYDFNESNNEANKSIEVPPACDLQTIIESNNTSPLFAENVNWIVCVKNNGPDNATNVKLQDILPSELIYVGHDLKNGIYENDVWDIGPLNVGDEVYLNIATVANALGVIVNDVSVNSTEYDWNMTNNYDDASIDVKAVADLSIIKLVDRSSPKYGDTVKWTLIAHNDGPNVANNVVVCDVLPEGLAFVKSNGRYSDGIWTIGSLNVGETKSLEITCKVTSTGDFVNMAVISSDEYDPDKSNNQAKQSISVGPASDLSITKIASKSKYMVGDVVEYMIEVVNNGPDTAYNVKVDEILDDLLKLKSFKLTKGKFNKFSLVWTIDRLDYGESARLFIKAIAIGSGVVKNKVVVSCDNYDWDLSNNKDLAIVKVAKKPLNKTEISPKNEKPNLNKGILSNLEMHPTANPLVILILSCVFSVIFLGKNISKKR